MHALRITKRRVKRQKRGLAAPVRAQARSGCGVAKPTAARDAVSDFRIAPTQGSLPETANNLQ